MNDTKTVTISGIVATGYNHDDDHNHYYLVQPDGYRIDMVARVAEIAEFMGGAMSAAWYISDTPKTKDQLVEGFLERVYGSVDARNWKESYFYSSWTHGHYDRETCEVGGHSLIDEWPQREGKFMLFEFTNKPEE